MINFKKDEKRNEQLSFLGKKIKYLLYRFASSIFFVKKQRMETKQQLNLGRHPQKLSNLNNKKRDSSLYLHHPFACSYVISSEPIRASLQSSMTQHHFTVDDFTEERRILLCSQLHCVFRSWKISKGEFYAFLCYLKAWKKT